MQRGRRRRREKVVLRVKSKEKTAMVLAIAQEENYSVMKL